MGASDSFWFEKISRALVKQRENEGLHISDISEVKFSSCLNINTNITTVLKL